MIAAHASPQSSAEHAEGPKHAADACHEEQHTRGTALTRPQRHLPEGGATRITGTATTVQNHHVALMITRIAEAQF